MIKVNHCGGKIRAKRWPLTGLELCVWVPMTSSCVSAVHRPRVSGIKEGHLPCVMRVRFRLTLSVSGEELMQSVAKFGLNQVVRG
jgi:hypothetical protein